MDELAEIGWNIYGRKTDMDVYGQVEALSKTAGCRFDSCPTCPSQMLNSSGLRPRDAQPVLRAFDPNVAKPQPDHRLSAGD
jgi:hypothetical protein